MDRLGLGLGLPQLERNPSYSTLVQCPRTTPSYNALVQRLRTTPSYNALVQCPRTTPSYNALIQCPRTMPSYSVLVQRRHTMSSYHALIPCPHTIIVRKALVVTKTITLTLREALVWIETPLCNPGRCIRSSHAQTLTIVDECTDPHNTCTTSATSIHPRSLYIYTHWRPCTLGQTHA